MLHRSLRKGRNTLSELLRQGAGKTAELDCAALAAAAQKCAHARHCARLPGAELGHRLLGPGQPRPARPPSAVLPAPGCARSASRETLARSRVSQLRAWSSAQAQLMRASARFRHGEWDRNASGGGWVMGMPPAWRSPSERAGGCLGRCLPSVCRPSAWGGTAATASQEQNFASYRRASARRLVPCVVSLLYAIPYPFRYPR